MKTTGLLGILTAFTSSLCCIAPLLALGGMAGSLGWLETARPYTIALSVGALGWAWYNQLRPAMKDACGCTPATTSFWQTRRFLGIMTGMAILLLTFPAYSNLLYQDKNQTTQQPGKPAQQIAYVTIKGMTCEGCEHHVKSEVGKLKGVAETKVSYQQGNAVVKYDPKQTSTADIKKAVAATGYQVVSVKTN
ncbi:mercuric transport protein MerTP [Nibrella saemangeumensis]